MTVIEPRPAELDVRTRRRLLLVAAAIIAGAGVAYELSLMLLGTVTVGSTERANAVVLGAAMLGMGIGATTGGRLAGRPVTAFVAVESLLAVLGAFAAPFLYWTWATLDAFWGPLLAVAIALGACIGAEMPLLAALNDRLASQHATKVVADYTAADYFGALGGALLFAFLLRPYIGLVDGTIVIAAVNLVVAGGVVLLVPTPHRRAAIGALAAGAVGVALAWGNADRIVDAGRQYLFRDPIIAVADTGLQEAVVTSRSYPGGAVDTRLFLDGDLQLSSLDAHRYHESLVHPALSLVSAAAGDVDNVLVLGGGDCAAVAEILRHDVARVVMVEIDRGVTDLVRRTPELAPIHRGACDDPRVEMVNDDAFTWARSNANPGGNAVANSDRLFDAIIVDFPDPDTPALGRLYSVEMYGLLARLLDHHGALVVQCGSPFFAPEAYWTCATTLEAAGLATTPYHVDVPSFGDWGFHLAAAGRPPQLVLSAGLDLRFLDADILRGAGAFPADTARDTVDVRPSTILDPVIVDAAQRAWIGY